MKTVYVLLIQAEQWDEPVLEVYPNYRSAWKGLVQYVEDRWNINGNHGQKPTGEGEQVEQYFANASEGEEWTIQDAPMKE